MTHYFSSVFMTISLILVGIFACRAFIVVIKNRRLLIDSILHDESYVEDTSESSTCLNCFPFNLFNKFNLSFISSQLLVLDLESVIDVSTLDSADRLQKSLSIHGIKAKVEITRTAPHPNQEWRLVIETALKNAWMDTFVTRFLCSTRLGQNEILSFNELMGFNNSYKY